MAGAVQINEIPEILVQSHHYSTFYPGALKQRPIPRIGTNLPRIKNIVSLRAQPRGKLPPCTLVEEEFHNSAIFTADRESPATTA